MTSVADHLLRGQQNSAESPEDGDEHSHCSINFLYMDK